MSTLPVEQRFWFKVDASGDCWEWIGGINDQGYGLFWLDKKMLRAHRVAWALLVGPIPDEMTLDHLCRNRRCVNPDHLEPVTLAENQARGFGKQHYVLRTGRCKRGHIFAGENLYTKPNGRHHMCRTCHRENTRKHRQIRAIA